MWENFSAVLNRVKNSQTNLLFWHLKFKVKLVAFDSLYSVLFMTKIYFEMTALNSSYFN